MSDDTSIDTIKTILKKEIAAHIFFDEHAFATIADSDLLFAGGNTLDSLDAVEVAVIMQRVWGVETKGFDVKDPAFATIDALAAFVKRNLPA